jgi:hypothetical protein
LRAGQQVECENRFNAALEGAVRDYRKRRRNKNLVCDGGSIIPVGFPVKAFHVNPDNHVNSVK